ncbi:S1 family peptidase [Streptosporangium lutulentum]
MTWWAATPTTSASPAAARSVFPWSRAPRAVSSAQPLRQDRCHHHRLQPDRPGRLPGIDLPRQRLLLDRHQRQLDGPAAVNNGEGGTIPVAGARVAIEGASVCRSGSTTDFHCGLIQQRDASVTYPQGTIFQLTRTNVCAEPGDSGGAFISIDQAQGVTSGGTGDCSSGGTTYFQPIGEILTAYGLSLRTTAGNPRRRPRAPAPATRTPSPAP